MRGTNQDDRFREQGALCDWVEVVSDGEGGESWEMKPEGQRVWSMRGCVCWLRE